MEMVIDDCRGAKRRLSDADESERLSQRQMILNMSICKMQRDNGKVEPKLLRTVLITNTVHRIEKEMEDELSYSDKGDMGLLCSFVKSLGGTAADVNWARNEPPNAFSEASTPAKLEQSFADIGLDIKPVHSSQNNNNRNTLDNDLETKTANLELTTHNAPPVKDDNCTNKFGCIGDRRRAPITTQEKHLDAESSSDRNPHYYLPNFILPSIFDIIDDNCMSDFDSLQSESDALVSAGINQFWNDDWNCPPDVVAAPIIQSSCASEVEKLKGDSFFEDLDQIMQVLVGM